MDIASVVTALFCGLIALMISTEDTYTAVGTPIHHMSWNVWTLVLLAVGVGVLIEGFLAKQKGHYSLVHRLLRLTQFNSPSFSDKKIAVPETRKAKIASTFE